MLLCIKRLCNLVKLIIGLSLVQHREMQLWWLGLLVGKFLSFWEVFMAQLFHSISSVLRLSVLAVEDD